MTPKIGRAKHIKCKGHKQTEKDESSSKSLKALEETNRCDSLVCRPSEICECGDLLVDWAKKKKSILHNENCPMFIDDEISSSGKGVKTDVGQRPTSFQSKSPQTEDSLFDKISKPIRYHIGGIIYEEVREKLIRQEERQKTLEEVEEMILGIRRKKEESLNRKITNNIREAILSHIRILNQQLSKLKEMKDE